MYFGRSGGGRVLVGAISSDFMVVHKIISLFSPSVCGAARPNASAARARVWEYTGVSGCTLADIFSKFMSLLAVC